MDIGACMKTNVVSIAASATIRDGAVAFVKHRIGLLPVLDAMARPVGVVSLPDLMALGLPDFVKFVADVDFVHDFGAVESTRPAAAILAKSVKTLMRPPIVVPENCGLLRAYALMLQHRLHDMLVVSEDGKLIGIASRVDIGTAVLSTWVGGAKK